MSLIGFSPNCQSGHSKSKVVGDYCPRSSHEQGARTPPHTHTEKTKHQGETVSPCTANVLSFTRHLLMMGPVYLLFSRFLPSFRVGTTNQTTSRSRDVPTAWVH